MNEENEKIPHWKDRMVPLRAATQKAPEPKAWFQDDYTGWQADTLYRALMKRLKVGNPPGDKKKNPPGLSGGLNGL